MEKALRCDANRTGCVSLNLPMQRLFAHMPLNSTLWTEILSVKSSSHREQKKKKNVLPFHVVEFFYTYWLQNIFLIKDLWCWGEHTLNRLWPNQWCHTLRLKVIMFKEENYSCKGPLNTVQQNHQTTQLWIFRRFGHCTCRVPQVATLIKYKVWGSFNISYFRKTLKFAAAGPHAQCWQ